MNSFKRKKHLITKKSPIDEKEVQRLQDDYEGRIRILELEIKTERRSTCNLHEDWKRVQRTVDERNNEIYKLRTNLNELKELSDKLTSELHEEKQEKDEILRLQQRLQDEIAQREEERSKMKDKFNSRLQEKEEKIYCLQTELNESAQRLEELEAKLEMESEEIRQAVATKERLQQTLEDHTRNSRYVLKGKENEIKMLRDKLASLKGQLEISTTQLKYERNANFEKEQRGTQIKAELVRCQDELEKNKQHEVILNGALKEKENELIKLQKEIRNSQQRLENQALQLQKEHDEKNEAMKLNIRKQEEIEKLKKENKGLVEKELALYTKIKENETKEREFKKDLWNFRIRLENRTQDLERLLKDRIQDVETSNKLRDEIEKNKLEKSKSDYEIVCLKRKLQEVQEDFEIMTLSCNCNRNVVSENESEDAETNRVLADAAERIKCLDSENHALRDENSNLRKSYEKLANIKSTVKITLNDVNGLKNGFVRGNGNVEDFSNSDVQIQHVTISGLKDEMNFLNDQNNRLFKITAHQRELLLKKRLKHDKINRLLNQLWAIIRKEEDKMESDDAHRTLRTLVQVMVKENGGIESGTSTPAYSDFPSILEFQDPNLRIKVQFQTTNDGSEVSECHLELPDVKKYLLRIIDPAVGHV
ncbi:hypothetical protein CHS0354_006249 [Potamilus streckersoni]|uniref:Uncharacterized protein n=1 Tax=Potamilus streckersoni TaxID=2493646 RepID=A0AAE0S4K4_9BIVA|nr:hypothetical protein CHS0354_006249 [Potamilus streckersoni]